MADQLEQSVKRAIELTDKEIELFIARLDKFLSKNLTRLLQDFNAGKVSARNAVKALGSLQIELRAAGLNKELAEIDRVYGAQLRAVNEHFRIVSGDKEVLNDVDYETAEQLIKFDTKLIGAKVNTLTDDLSSKIFRSVIAGETPNVSELIDTHGARFAAQVETELNTATSAFSRAITAKKAKEAGFELYVYLGPVDKVTRPFCRQRVGKVFSLKEIKTWDNGQGLDPVIYLGGFNCRHQLRPVSEEYAKKNGYKGESGSGTE